MGTRFEDAIADLALWSVFVTAVGQFFVTGFLAAIGYVDQTPSSIQLAVDDGAAIAVPVLLILAHYLVIRVNPSVWRWIWFWVVSIGLVAFSVIKLNQPPEPRVFGQDDVIAALIFGLIMLVPLYYFRRADSGRRVRRRPHRRG